MTARSTHCLETIKRDIKAGMFTLHPKAVMGAKELGVETDELFEIIDCLDDTAFHTTNPDKNRPHLGPNYWHDSYRIEWCFERDENDELTDCWWIYIKLAGDTTLVNQKWEIASFCKK